MESELVAENCGICGGVVTIVVDIQRTAIGLLGARGSFKSARTLTSIIGAKVDTGCIVLAAPRFTFWRRLIAFLSDPKRLALAAGFSLRFIVRAGSVPTWLGATGFIVVESVSLVGRDSVSRDVESHSSIDEALSWDGASSDEI